MKSSLIFIITLLFSSVALGQRTVEQVAAAGGCSTSAVKGLSEQLIDETQCLAPGTFKSISGYSRISLGSSAFPYLQSAAADALVKVVNRAGKTLSVNSALRTLPQQYLLYRWNNLGLCGITAAAAPGRSNHNGGLAVDVNSYSSWINDMSAHNWQWFGNGDKVHFDYRGSGTKDIRSLSVKAFQRLWNRNNPNDKIDEDGVYGTNTEKRLQKSPANGFAKGAQCSSLVVASGNTYSGPVTCTVNGNSGVCIDTSECTGTSTAGYCSGGSSIQCCTNSTTSLSSCTIASGEKGTCQSVSSCSGKAVAGYCPGDNTIRCCVSGSYTTTRRTTNQNGIDLIKSFEGYYANFYTDPVGIKTIGYGHACHVNDCNNLQAKDTSGNWRRVYAPLSRTDAEDLLRGDLDKGGYEDCVNDKVTRSTLTNDQFGALVSFVFNVGCGGFSGSTLLRRVNANAAVEGSGGVREAFLMWNKGGGKELPGLTRRRNAEADLYGGTTRSTPGTGEGDDCWYKSQKGVCIDTSRCTGTTYSGLCSGGSNIKCCIGNKCTVKSTNDGKCIMTSLCKGTKTAGKCFGASDIMCCTTTKRETLATSVVCPDGATYDDTLKFCVTDDEAYGPFPQAMIDKCTELGGGSACNNKVLVTVNGKQIYLLRWSRSVMESARGTDVCPAGTTLDQNALGECAEYIGDADSGYTRMAVYGGFDSEVSTICDTLSGGDSCYTTRWSMKYYVSVINPGGYDLLTNETVNVDYVNDTDDAATDTTNPWVEDQYKYTQSNSEECEGQCIIITAAAVGITAGILAAIIVSAVVFVALGGFAGKKGYDVWVRAQDKRMSQSAPTNPMYRDRGRTGVNPMYNNNV